MQTVSREQEWAPPVFDIDAALALTWQDDEDPGIRFTNDPAGLAAIWAPDEAGVRAVRWQRPVAPEIIDSLRQADRSIYEDGAYARAVLSTTSDAELIPRALLSELTDLAGMFRKYVLAPVQGARTVSGVSYQFFDKARVPPGFGGVRRAIDTSISTLLPHADQTAVTMTVAHAKHKNAGLSYFRGRRTREEIGSLAAAFREAHDIAAERARHDLRTLASGEVMVAKGERFERWNALAHLGAFPRQGDLRFRSVWAIRDTVRVDPRTRAPIWERHAA